MKIGCHAVLFTDQIAIDTEGVLSGLAASGGKGVEIGARFFGIDKNMELKGLLEAHKMELSGLHAVILLTDLLDQPDKVRDTIAKAAEFLQVMPNKNIILTGGKQMPPVAGENHENREEDRRLSDPAQVKTIAKMLNEMSSFAKESGVQIHYHNHDWEFEHNGILYEAFIKYAPDMNFALDTGWALSSGWNPVKMIEEHPSRYTYVHIRDFRKKDMVNCHNHIEKQDKFVDLGEGDVDLKQLMTTLKTHMPDNGWVVIEYEKGEVSFERYVRAVQYLETLLSSL